MRNLERWYGFAWVLLLAACGDPTAPVLIVQPTLSSMSARAFPFRFQGTWGLLVEGTVADGDTSAMTPDARLPLRVTTTSGDVEDMLLWPRVCESDAGGRHLCGTFLFSMQPGRHVNDVRPFLGQLDGGLASVDTRGSWASVWLFDSEIERAMRSVRRWPGVQFVERNGLAYLAVGPIPPLFGPVVSVSPIVLGPASRGDGTVRALPGDVVTARYTSAEGLETIATFTMCEEPSENLGTPITGLGEDPPCG